jgi:RNA polymerase sigma factor for flagellar operon FliA
MPRTATSIGTTRKTTRVPLRGTRTTGRTTRSTRAATATVTAARPARAKSSPRVTKTVKVKASARTVKTVRASTATTKKLALVAATTKKTPPVTYCKDDLLKRFAPLVRHVVERVAAGLPKNVDHEDLYSAGVLGLLDAHAKFDTGKGVKFETYAVWRIKGAVLDQLRALDWVSRSMRRKARNLDGVTRKLDQKLGRAASEEEVAKEMEMSRSEFYRLLDHVRGAVLVSLDESRSGEEQEPSTLADQLADPDAPDFEARLEDEQTRNVILTTLNHLPEQERLVVALYYYEHLTLKEIGRAMGISESRVSQVHTRAVGRLRLRLNKTLYAEREAA